MYGIISASLGIVFLIVTGSLRSIKIGIVLFAIYSILNFAIGNRGEVMYSAVTALALFALRFKLIKAYHIIAGLIFLVVLIPFIRVFREGNFASYRFNLVESFLDAIAEEGFQISSFTYIVEHLSKSRHVWGMTYVNYVTDFIYRRIGQEGPYILIDNYNIKSLMPYKGMGFSMIAELYYNFTIVGAFIIYFVFGVYMCLFDWNIVIKKNYSTFEVFFSLLVVELINMTRNDSSTMPLYLFFILVFTFVYFVCHLEKTAENV